MTHHKGMVHNAIMGHIYIYLYIEYVLEYTTNNNVYLSLYTTVSKYHFLQICIYIYIYIHVCVCVCLEHKKNPRQLTLKWLLQYLGSRHLNQVVQTQWDITHNNKTNTGVCLNHIVLQAQQTLQTLQNTALHIASGYTPDTNIQHLHKETIILPLHTHLKLHKSQISYPTHKA